MSVTLTIRNVPDETAQRLRKRAKQNHRSIQGELMAILESATETRPLTAHEIRETNQKLGFRTESDSTQIVREMRDARHGR